MKKKIVSIRDTLRINTTIKMWDLYYVNIPKICPECIEVEDDYSMYSLNPEDVRSLVNKPYRLYDNNEVLRGYDLVHYFMPLIPHKEIKGDFFLPIAHFSWDVRGIRILRFKKENGKLKLIKGEFGDPCYYAKESVF